MKKYEILFYKDEKETVIKTVNNLNEAIEILKSIANKYKMKPCKTFDKDVVMQYSKEEESYIVCGCGIIKI